MADDAQAADLLRSAFLTLHAGNRDGAQRVLDLIDAETRVRHRFWQAVQDHFGVSAWN